MHKNPDLKYEIVNDTMEALNWDFLFCSITNENEDRRIFSMKIIVTGITGFIGRNFAKAVADNGNQYVCLVRKTSYTDNLIKAKNIEYIITDFSVKNLSQTFADADAVIHMAGQIGSYGITEERFIEGNYNLTKNVMQACDIANVKQIVYISTPGVTGFGKRLSTEKDSYAPRGMYEQTKEMAEKAILTYGGGG